MSHIIGIDIGKDKIHISTPTPDEPPKQWVVHVIDMKDPNWWHDLIGHVSHNALVAAEATGYHWFAPIARVLIDNRAANIWYVDGRTTRQVRNVNISKHKTDNMDARALTLIAQRLAGGQAQAGCYPFNLEELTQVNHLRLLVNAHRRSIKQVTRRKNQLRALAHSVWPLLSQRLPTWRTCLTYNCVSPAQIHWLAENMETKMDGRRRRHIANLASLMPPIDADPVIETQSINIDAALRIAESETKDIESEITELLNAQFPIIANRWRTIPASSDIFIAALLVATYGKPDEFERDNFVAAVGAAPLWRSSGKQHKTKPRKTGYRPAVDALHLWTLLLLNSKQPENPVRNYYKAGQRRKLPAARNKLARLLWSVAQSEEGYIYKKTEKEIKNETDRT